MAFREAKNAIIWPKIHFLETSSKMFVIIMTGHKKDNFFVFHVRHLDGRQGPFLVLKSAFLRLSPHNPPFLGADKSDSKQLIASYDISWYFMVFHGIASIVLYSIALISDWLIGYGAQAASRKTPINFMIYQG